MNLGNPAAFLLKVPVHRIFRFFKVRKSGNEVYLQKNKIVTNLFQKKKNKKTMLVHQKEIPVVTIHHKWEIFWESVNESHGVFMDDCFFQAILFHIFNGIQPSVHRIGSSSCAYWLRRGYVPIKNIKCNKVFLGIDQCKNLV